MATITSVELGADTCALARTSVRRGELRLVAAEILDPAAFPSVEAFTAAVRQTRRTLGLPRRCRVVIWGLPDGANRKDIAVTPLLEPLIAAGFRVERVVSPCNALAALARVKTSRGDGSTCWLAINRGGVAIVVVRPGRQLYAHSFVWDSNLGASGSQARLLQRYSLVSHLAPEVQRAMAEARRYGTPVDAVVTCGNLPDLRSLTMPLIEELDVEVETLDSLEGLMVTPQAADALADAAPAIRLACAGAIARGTRPLDESKRRTRPHVIAAYVAAAVLAAAAVGLAYLWYGRTRSAGPAGPPPQSQLARAQNPSPAVSVPPPVPRIDGRGPAAGNPATGPRSPAVQPRTQAPPPPPATSAPPPAATSNPPAAGPPKPAGEAPGAAGLSKPAVVAPPPVATSPRNTAVSPPPPAESTVASPPAAPAKITVTSPPAGRPVSPQTRPQPPAQAVSERTAPGTSEPRPSASVETRTPGSARPPAVTTRGEPIVTVPRPSVPRSPARPAAAGAGSSGLTTAPVRADKPEAGLADRVPSSQGAATARGPMPALLGDAVPRVTAILVSRDRRYATIDGGHIIGIGDLLGRRSVVGMDQRSVVLREPSGVQIRVGLGGRLLGVERGR